MQEYQSLLRHCPLFDGIAAHDLAGMLACLDARVQTYQKGQTVLAEGAPAEHFGIVLSGAVQIVRDDFYGNRSIIARIAPPQIFGEAFACAETDALPVSVTAAEDTAVMLIRSRRITQPCGKACGFHSRLIFNLLKIVSGKNLLFHRRIEITSQRTTRDKLLTYLHLQAKQCGSNRFVIPFDRQGLADFLDVERSGLSAEIGKLCRAGVIECRRSSFVLKRPQP